MILKLIWFKHHPSSSTLHALLKLYRLDTELSHDPYIPLSFRSCARAQEDNQHICFALNYTSYLNFNLLNFPSWGHEDVAGRDYTGFEYRIRGNKERDVEIEMFIGTCRTFVLTAFISKTPSSVWKHSRIKCTLKQLLYRFTYAYVDISLEKEFYYWNREPN